MRKPQSIRSRVDYSSLIRFSIAWQTDIIMLNFISKHYFLKANTSSKRRTNIAIRVALSRISFCVYLFVYLFAKHKICAQHVWIICTICKREVFKMLICKKNKHIAITHKVIFTFCISQIYSILFVIFCLIYNLKIKFFSLIKFSSLIK